jgi:uncharacterized repeat protein (TIGR03803 family)
LARDAAGNLYGTTYYGGELNLGTVFKVAPDGTETVLHSFTGPPDGALPSGGVILDSLGNLYGTTSSGCSGYPGTVFKIDPTGVETVLHVFDVASDGYQPIGGLAIDMAGNLYGTTYAGGSFDWGTVFKIDPSGTETILHEFNETDGERPTAPLLLSPDGTLFGTTSFGGLYTDGVIFRLQF